MTHEELTARVFAERNQLAAEIQVLRNENIWLHTNASALDAAKQGAYAERDRLVCALSKLWPAHLARHPDDDTTWDDDWRWIVCVHSPVGQLTWHIHDTERDWFTHLPVAEGHWDGHTTEQKYARLATLVAEGPR